MSKPVQPSVRSEIALALAAAAYLVAACVGWHEEQAVRRAAGLVVATLILWICEAAPLGVVAMAIPVAATLAGVLPWKDAIGAWADPVVFLFLGAFLLARAMEKHGVFHGILEHKRLRGARGGAGLILAVLVISGAISTLQNNTAVTAMMLPIVATMAGRSRLPFAPLLALAWGSTFGGMATPVGTAPNFIGFAAMKRLDADISFLSWMKVGMPVWIGTTLIGWGVLVAATRARGRKSRAIQKSELGLIDRLLVTDVGPPSERAPAADSSNRSSRRARRVALGAFVAAVLLWLVPGLIQSATRPDHPAAVFARTYLPESLVPLAVAWVLFIVPVGARGERVLERRDFQMLDWDTLFLIAGGMSLGRMLETSGAAAALARAATGWEMSPTMLMIALAGVTVLLSELTSNTATASLMVPIAGSLAAGLGVSQVGAIWLVALAASLGFAMPISTPPNALVYGTRMVPLRTMIWTGLAVDVLAVFWVVFCVRVFGDGM